MGGRPPVPEVKSTHAATRSLEAGETLSELQVSLPFSDPAIDAIHGKQSREVQAARFCQVTCRSARTLGDALEAPSTGISENITLSRTDPLTSDLRRVP